MKHNQNRKIAAFLVAITVLATIFLACITLVYLPVSRERIPMTMCCAITGSVVALLIYALLMRFPNQRVLRFSLCAIVALPCLLPVASIAVQRISYARFGFTVYGVTPIPIFDMTVNSAGVLWFRPKTHQITRNELESLITPEVEIVVVGIGWNSVAKLTENAKKIGDSVDLRVLPTPEAFALFNALKAEGRTVVLLAHSTC